MAVFGKRSLTTASARRQEFCMKKIVGYIKHSQGLGQLSEDLKDVVKEPQQGILVCKSSNDLSFE